jgi:sphinganine C4-monooxygenase
MIVNTTISAVSYDPPFYYSPRQRFFDDVPDHLTTVAVPIIAYWSLSLFFHSLDMSGWKWLEKYKIHDSEEVKKRNLVGRTEVVLAVIFQQVVQTLLGLMWLKEDPVVGGIIHHGMTEAVVKGLQRWERLLQPVVDRVFWIVNGLGFGEVVKWGAAGGVLGVTSGGREEVLAKAVYFVYWWGVPIFQFFAAMYVSLTFDFSFSLIRPSLNRFFIDTWQYFLHRAMHVNKFLYKTLHIWHHRLYVPYAFGALYNHPIEGFVLDSLGAALAEMFTGMTTRQAAMLFFVSTLKTVDDHCGYSLPWDPLQMFSGNNADYHDIHHQVSRWFLWKCAGE